MKLLNVVLAAALCVAPCAFAKSTPTPLPKEFSHLPARDVATVCALSLKAVAVAAYRGSDGQLDKETKEAVMLAALLSEVWVKQSIDAGATPAQLKHWAHFLVEQGPSAPQLQYCTATAVTKLNAMGPAEKKKIQARGFEAWLEISD